MSKYKIFISYAHIDNQTIANQEWVDEFHKNLSNNIAVQLGRREYFDIWFDKTSLQGHARLTEEIKSKVCEADIFVMILSRGYLASDWCMEELKTFIEHNSSDDNLSNIFIIQKESLSIETKPSAIQDIWGYEFWFIDDKAKCRTYRSNYPKKEFEYFNLIEDVSSAIGEYLESGKAILNTLPLKIETPSSISKIFLIFNQSNSYASQYSVVGYIHRKNEFKNDLIEFTFKNIYNQEEQEAFIQLLVDEFDDSITIHFIIPPELFLVNFKQWKFRGNELVKRYHILLHNKDRYNSKHSKYEEMIEKWNLLFEYHKQNRVREALLLTEDDDIKFDTRLDKMGVCFKQKLSNYEVVNNTLDMAKVGLWQCSDGVIEDYHHWVDGTVCLKDLNKASRQCDHVALLWDDMSLLEKLKNRK